MIKKNIGGRLVLDMSFVHYVRPLRAEIVEFRFFGANNVIATHEHKGDFKEW